MKIYMCTIINMIRFNQDIYQDNHTLCWGRKRVKQSRATGSYSMFQPQTQLLCSSTSSRSRRDDYGVYDQPTAAVAKGSYDAVHRVPILATFLVSYLFCACSLSGRHWRWTSWCTCQTASVRIIAVTRWRYSPCEALAGTGREDCSGRSRHQDAGATAATVGGIWWNNNERNKARHDPLDGVVLDSDDGRTVWPFSSTLFNHSLFSGFLAFDFLVFWSYPSC